jgi:hypothetical protein
MNAKKAARIEALTSLAIGARVANGPAVADYLSPAVLTGQRPFPTLADITCGYATTTRVAREAQHILRERRATASPRLTEKLALAARLLDAREALRERAPILVELDDAPETRLFSMTERHITTAWRKAGFRLPEGRGPKVGEYLRVVTLGTPDEDAKNGIFPRVETKVQTVRGAGKWAQGKAVDRRIVVRFDWLWRIHKAGLSNLDGGFCVDLVEHADGTATAKVLHQSRGFDLRTDDVRLRRDATGAWVKARKGVR